MAYDPDVGNPTGKHRPKRRHHGQGSRPFRVTDARRRRPWRCDLRMGRDPATGKLRTKSFWGTSAAEAAALRDEYRDRLRRAGSAEAAERTVSVMLAEWYAERAPNVDPSTKARYAGIVAHHLVKGRTAPGRNGVLLGDLLVLDVTHADVLASRASWVTQPRGKSPGGKPLSASASNLALGILREALATEVKLGRIETDPTAEVARRRRTSSPARYLTLEQALALRDALKGDPLELVVKVGLAVGPRRGEILGMRWSDIDLPAGTWQMNWQLRSIAPRFRHEGEGPYRLVRLKGDHATGRVLALPAFLVTALTAHKAVQDPIRKRAKVWVKPGDLVFCDEIGQALPPGSVTRRFEQLAARAGLGHLRLHDLRHSYGTIATAMGINPRVIQANMGHATPRQTAEYTHVVESLGRDAADVFDEAMGGAG
jgi:integrase